MSETNASLWYKNCVSTSEELFRAQPKGRARLQDGLWSSRLPAIWHVEHGYCCCWRKWLLLNAKVPMMRVKKGKQLFRPLAVLLFVMAAEVARPDTSTVSSLVRFSASRLTIRAEEISLKDLAQEIRKKSGIIVELRDSKAAEKRLTLDLKNVSPELAFEEILRGFSFAVFYDDGRLAQVVVLSAEGSPAKLELSSRPSPRPPPSDKSRLLVKPTPDKPSPSASMPDFEELLEQNREEGMKVLSEALASPDPKVKRAALEALAETEGPDVLPLLSGALRDPDPSIRMEVLEALADKGELQAVRGALSDQNREVRERAAELLESDGEGENKAP